MENMWPQPIYLTEKDRAFIALCVWVEEQYARWLEDCRQACALPAEMMRFDARAMNEALAQ